MSSIPFELISSSRPINGETHQAPALAASNACVGGETESHVHFDPLSGQALRRFQPFGNQWAFDHDIFVDLGQLFPLPSPWRQLPH